eukprot:scaffold14004_cov111-Isochrysis_galbana.AAC.7
MVTAASARCKCAANCPNPTTHMARCRRSRGGPRWPQSRTFAHGIAVPGAARAPALRWGVRLESYPRVFTPENSRFTLERQLGEREW